MRPNPMLPAMISENQSGFIKGRSVTENLLMALEIVQGINLPNKGGNMIIKLDIAKAYERFCGSFLLFCYEDLGLTKCG